MFLRGGPHNASAKNVSRWNADNDGYLKNAIVLPLGKYVRFDKRMRRAAVLGWVSDGEGCGVAGVMGLLTFYLTWPWPRTWPVAQSAVALEKG